jgi:hypothetical protein
VAVPTSATTSAAVTSHGSARERDLTDTLDHDSERGERDRADQERERDQHTQALQR